MAIELVVDSLDAIDESLKGAYAEKDGKFSLDPDKYAEVKASGLKKKNGEILGKLKATNESLKRFEKLSELDDDELAELLNLRESGKQNGNGKADPDEVAKITKQHEKAIQKANADKAAIEQQLADAIKENRHFKITVPVRKAAEDAGVLKNALDDVVLLTSGRFRLDDAGKVEVLDKDGDPLGITPQKFFETVYKDEKPLYYQASGAGGSGAQTTNGGNSVGKKTIKRSEYDDMVMRGEKVDWKTTVVVD